MISIVAGVWPLGLRAIDRTDTPSPLLSSFEITGSWRASDGGLTTWKPRFENPSAELHRTFMRGGDEVGLYIGYYRNQSSSQKLVSSDNVLVATNDRNWTKVGSGIQAIAIGDRSLVAGSAELRGPGDQRLVVWHWYWIDGRLTSSDVWAKGYTALSRLIGRGDDSAIVVVYARKDGAGAAALEAFVRDAGPGISSWLAQTRDRR
jgi:EpsI family protein